MRGNFFQKYSFVLKQLFYHSRGFVDVSAAEGDNHITRFCVFGNIIGNFSECFKLYAARYLLCEVGGVNTERIYLAGAHNFGHNNPVGD